MGAVGNFILDVKLAKVENDAKKQMLDKMGVDVLKAIAKRKKIGLKYYDGEQWVPYTKKTSIVNVMTKKMSYDSVMAVCKSNNVSVSSIEKQMEAKKNEIKLKKQKQATKFVKKVPLKKRMKEGINKTKQEVKSKARKGLIDFFI
jgi:hypothetical protein